MKKYILVIFCLISFYGFSQKCTHTLKGTIVDFHDGKFIEGATILVKNTSKYAVSNAKGEFVIKSLCDGKITVVISHIGCKTIEKTIELKGDYTSKFLLEHHSEELEEVTVKGKSIPKKTSSLSETVLKKGVLESYSAASLGDALKEVAGVSSINTGNSIVKPMINGMHSSRIIVMNNGVRLQDQEWGIEHAPNVDINSAESISVIKGAGALAYGSDAIGGVIVLNPKNPIKKDSLYGKTITGFQTNGRGFNLASSLSKTFNSGYFINANVSYKLFGDHKAPDYFLTNTASNSSAFSLDAGYKTFEKGWSFFFSGISSDIGILRAAHIGSIQDLINAIDSPEPTFQDSFDYKVDFPKQTVEHWIAKANYFKRFENLGKLSLQYDFQVNNRLEFDRRIGDNRFTPAVDLNLTTHSGTLDFLFDSSDSWKIKTGGLLRFQQNIASPDTDVRRLIPDYIRTDWGLYITGKHELNDNLEFDFGARYDYNFYDVKKFYLISRWNALGYDALFSDLIIRQESSQYLINAKLKYHNFAVSSGLNWDVSDNNNLLFNYTLSKRPPNISELFSDGLHHSAARIELGDLTLDSETSHRVSTSFIGKTEKSDWQLDGYINNIQNYIYIAPGGTEQTIRGAFPVWNYLQTNALFFGFDANYNQQLTDNWSYRFNASYIYAQDTKSNRPVIDIPPFQMRNSISYQNEKWNNFSSTLVSEFVGKQNRFPDFNFLQTIPQTGQSVLVDISSSPSAYHLLHIQNSMDLHWFKKAKVQLSFNINNLLNTSYRDYLNRLRFFADELGRNFQIQLKINY